MLGPKVEGLVCFCKRDLTEPRVKVFATEFVNLGMAINLDIVPSLYNIDTVKHVKKSLSLDWDRELVVKEV